MEGVAKEPQLQVYQPKNAISVQIGDNLTLECRVTGEGPPGPVRWFLGEGPTKKVIYAGAGSFERITRNNEKSNEDFTIVIHNVTWEDAGIYYCVKIKSHYRKEDVILRGGGTEVVVTDSPPPNTAPVVAGVSVLLLTVLLLVAVYIYLKKRKGRNQETSRPEAPTQENTSFPKQGVVNKEIVYADLKDPSGLRRPKQRKTEEHSEYASVRVA
ncbi:signalbeta-1-likeregulatory phosphatase non-receptor type substrate 1-like [Podarcis lilfordi]|uniref:Signalbeta-1-likeregulatory phosphatase non-receptor type substrate 1-like n=1 Tax=Podarcis lilfordi TaxID=74358 RepID=A0AA35P7I9_9SAUR|nr:signalbeta-1-likeregulatory phosphatase non-receptor type substrate 1-like [Podarcis lilfordi]